MLGIILYLGLNQRIERIIKWRFKNTKYLYFITWEVYSLPKTGGSNKNGMRMFKIMAYQEIPTDTRFLNN